MVTQNALLSGPPAVRVGLVNFSKAISLEFGTTRCEVKCYCS